MGSYCMQCWSAFQEQLCKSTDDMCVECGLRPGEEYGSNEFAECLYCTQCFNEFRKQLCDADSGAAALGYQTGMCASCEVAQGELPGTQESLGLMYCRTCWES